jgi:hypothetical protein
MSVLVTYNYERGKTGIASALYNLGNALDGDYFII